MGAWGGGAHGGVLWYWPNLVGADSLPFTRRSNPQKFPTPPPPPLPPGPFRLALPHEPLRLNSGSTKRHVEGADKGALSRGLLWIRLR